MQTGRHFERLRRIADYLQATENEIAVDALAFRLSATDPSRMGFIPRPAKWLRQALRRPWLFRATSWFIALVWRWGGASMFFLAQFVLAALHARRCGAVPPTFPLQGAFALGLSSRAGEVIQTAEVEDAPKTWITMPWAPLDAKPEYAELFDVFSLLGLRQLLSAYSHAVAAAGILSRRERTTSWTMQSYTAFRWFAVRLALERLSGRFVMAEHYDRWAVLADSVVVHKRHRAMLYGEPNASLELVQHGAIGSLSKSDGRSSLILRRRLRAVDALYAYDAVSEAAFAAEVLSPAAIRRGVKVRHYRPTVTLAEAGDSALCQVLFVGHPLCEDVHVHLLRSLQESHVFEALYKPHPLAPMSPDLSRMDWHVIRDKEHFPSVHLVISYPSTLVVEYASHDIPAIVHPIDLRSSDAQPFIEMARRQLDAISRSPEARLQPGAAAAAAGAWAPQPSKSNRQTTISE